MTPEPDDEFEQLPADEIARMYGPPKKDFRQHGWYLFVRFRTGLVSSNPEIQQLIPFTGDTVETLEIDEGRGWHDGLILRFVSLDEPRAVLARFRAGLSFVDAWALHDGHAFWAESMEGGPFSIFFDEPEPHPENPSVTSFSQIAFISRERDRDNETSSAALRSAFPVGRTVRPVFWFRDGGVHFIAPAEPAETSLRRVERLRNQLGDVAFVDDRDRAVRLRGRHDEAWETTVLSETEWENS